jgi:hypothetical protein
MRFSGGPTYVRVDQEMAGEVFFDPAYYNVRAGSLADIDVTGYQPASGSGGAWGWHVGADVSVFVTRFVGIGAGFRVNRGMVEIDEPLSGEEVDLDVGSAAFNVGARVRF